MVEALVNTVAETVWTDGVRGLEFSNEADDMVQSCLLQPWVDDEIRVALKVLELPCLLTTKYIT